jgi:hypothetical protein
MEISSLLFALGLFMAGIWLIFIINGDFKEKKRRAQQISDAQHRRPLPSRRVAQGGARQSPASKGNATDSATAGGESAEPIDEQQGLNTAVVRERFERFTHETRRTR